LEVATPLFNGGAGEGTAELRISSLRGAMRFWFRALAGVGIGNNLKSLTELEKHVFGDTDLGSPVRLRVATMPRITNQTKPRWCQGDDGRWIVYLLGQGLGDLRTATLRRPYIEVGEPIAIQLRLSGRDPVDALVLASLWLTCALGGLGARTRRGFGGL